jgi:acyl carrier protein
MVPSAVAALAELPRLPNGKIDRKRLPEVETGTAADEHVPPETDTERALAGIWQEVLDRDRVGATDDFFALGGHSLLATRVIARVHRRLDAELPLRALFEHPTLRALAQEVDKARQAPEKPPQPRIQRLERTRTTRPVTV